MNINMSELFGKKEDLHPDLIPYLVAKPFPMLNAPLVQSVMHSTEMNAVVNAQYKHKLAAIEKARDEKNWSTYIYMHERPYRLDAFLAIYNKMSNREYWENLASIWIDCENPYINIKIWKSLIQVIKPAKYWFMTNDDRKIFLTLNDEITIYRGYVEIKGKKDVGISYTLDKDRAVWFANRFNKGGKVKEITVKKKDVFAYTNSRGEDEIIYLK